MVILDESDYKTSAEIFLKNYQEALASAKSMDQVARMVLLLAGNCIYNHDAMLAYESRTGSGLLNTKHYQFLEISLWYCIRQESSPTGAGPSCHFPDSEGESSSEEESNAAPFAAAAADLDLAED